VVGKLPRGIYREVEGVKADRGRPPPAPVGRLLKESTSRTPDDRPYLDLAILPGREASLLT
jgi:hypothetical protein